MLGFSALGLRVLLSSDAINEGWFDGGVDQTIVI